MASSMTTAVLALVPVVPFLDLDLMNMVVVNHAIVSYDDHTRNADLHVQGRGRNAYLDAGGNPHSSGDDRSARGRRGARDRYLDDGSVVLWRWRDDHYGALVLEWLIDQVHTCETRALARVLWPIVADVPVHVPFHGELAVGRRLVIVVMRSFEVAILHVWVSVIVVDDQVHADGMVSIIGVARTFVSEWNWIGHERVAPVVNAVEHLSLGGCMDMHVRDLDVTKTAPRVGDDGMDPNVVDLLGEGVLREQKRNGKGGCEDEDS